MFSKIVRLGLDSYKACLMSPLPLHFHLSFLSETHLEYAYNYIYIYIYNSLLFCDIYRGMGHSLGIFAVLFQRCNIAVETIWFCPMLI